MPSIGRNVRLAAHKASGGASNAETNAMAIRLGVADSVIQRVGPLGLSAAMENVMLHSDELEPDLLATAGKVDSLERGRACRWMARQMPGFPTSLLRPVALTFG